MGVGHGAGDAAEVGGGMTSEHLTKALAAIPKARVADENTDTNTNDHATQKSAERVVVSLPVSGTAPHHSATVPRVPLQGRGNGGTGTFRERSGTTGTPFESIEAFLARADSAPPIEYLIEKLVPGSGKVMMYSAPNAGKTWLALLILKTAAALGRSCFLVEEEGGLRALANRMRTLGLQGLPTISVAHLRGVSLDDRKMVKLLCDELAATDAPVLVLDPLNSVWGGDENDTHAATQLRQVLDALARANPRALIAVLHHTSKAGERGEGSKTYAGRGSSVFAGWADCSLHLSYVPTPKGAGRVVFDVEVAKMRDDEREQVTRFEVELGTGTISMEARSKGAGTGVELEAKITAALKAAAEPLTRSALRAVVHVRNEALVACVEGMLSKSLLRVDPKGRLSVAPTGAQRDMRFPAEEAADA